MNPSHGKPDSRQARLAQALRRNVVRRKEAAVRDTNEERPRGPAPANADHHGDARA